MRRTRMQAVIAMLTLLAWRAGHAQSSPAQAICPQQPTESQMGERVDRLIAAMTLPERIAQLQDRAPAITRLNLPAWNWWNEGLHGLARDGYATVFPQAIGLAATWDPALLHAVGETVGNEARAKFNGHGGREAPRYGGLTVWSPNVNIFRDPRWGRGQETYGEDPYLTGTLGTAFVTGMQGNDPMHPQANATPKHFAAHSGPEEGRDSFNAVVSAHDLADTYTPAFHALVTQGHAAALMCSYNEINGVPSCARTETLQHLLREDWGFSGYVVSDCDAVGDISAYHHFVADDAHAAAAALNAGVDLDCGNTYNALGKSYAQGLVTEATINRALHRLMLARARLGALPGVSCPDGRFKNAALHTPEHAALALRAAEESAVLLKNDGVLPLKSDAKVAIIGPTADMLKVLEANYHGTAEHPVTLLDGLTQAYPAASYAQGSLLASGLSLPIPRTALRTGRGPGAQPGLAAEYFNTPSLNGEPAVRALVPKVDLDLDRVGPDARVTAKHYAARWKGYLTPPAAGEYALRVNIERCWDCTAHDSFRLYLDGKLVLDNNGSKGSVDKTSIHLVDTRPHALTLELLHTGDDEGIGLEWIPPAGAQLEEAARVASAADVVIACVGLSPDLEGEALQVELPGFAGGDRTSLDLPATQLALLQRLRATGKKVVVVLSSGSAVALGAAGDAASAILEAWYPGESGGTAVAHLLTGQVNPSGRLPVTFYRSVADLPAFTDYSMTHRTYRYFDKPVEYGFGYGLSYTRFAYSDLRLSAPTLEAGSPLTATVTVRNAGEHSGAQVSELYLIPPSIPGAPRLELRDVQRVQLAPNESKTLHFTLSPYAMSLVDLTGTRRVVAGNYRVFVGGAQPEAPGTQGADFKVTGAMLVPPAP